MKIKKLILSTILSYLVASSVLGQSATQAPASPYGGKAVDEKPDKKALEKKALTLIDEILKETANLRLPENRIQLQAGAADVLWKYDEKRARALFKQAMDTLGDLVAEMGATSSSRVVNRNLDYLARVRSRTELRREILQMVAQHDARLAREFLRGTRQSGLTAEGNREGIDQERHMELELAAQVAATDPSQALQIAEESLEGGSFREELPRIIRQIATKDPDAAAKLVSDVVKRLRAVNLPTDRSACIMALAILRIATNREEGDSDSGETRSGSSKPPQILDEKTLRDLVDMVAAGALATMTVDHKSPTADGKYSGGSILVADIDSFMTEVEKYAPGRAGALKKKIAEAEPDLDPGSKALIESLKSNSAASPSVDSLLEAATKAPPELRDALWSQAAMKALEEGDTDRARQIVSEHSDPGERDDLLEQIDVQALQRATEAGRLDEARQLLSGASVEQRVSVLTQFASRAITKGDKKVALQILEEARDLIGAQAANGAELNALLGIARIYATVEAARSFDIVEPIVDQLNRLLSAAAVVDGFEFEGYFKEGELLPAQGQSPLINILLQFNYDTVTLARADFDRARALADKFGAGDVRLKARLAVAQGILLDNLPVREGMTIGGRYYRSAGQMIIQH